MYCSVTIQNVLELNLPEHSRSEPSGTIQYSFEPYKAFTRFFGLAFELINRRVSPWISHRREWISNSLKSAPTFGYNLKIPNNDITKTTLCERSHHIMLYIRD